MRLGVLLLVAAAAAQDPAVPALREGLARATEPLVREVGDFAFRVRAERDGEAPLVIELVRRGEDAFALRARSRHADFDLVRDTEQTRLVLPRAGVVLVGRGAVEADASLVPAGIVGRLLGERAGALALVRAAALIELDAGRMPELDGYRVAFEFDVAPHAAEVEFQERVLDRAQLERTVFRALKRVIELRLVRPTEPVRPRAVEGGELLVAEGQRVARLAGSPEQLGRAHGELLAPLVRRTVDSCLHLVGLVETVRTGRWFQDELEAAWQRLQVPARHVREIDALADAVPGVSRRELRLANVFPEYFHCSGFAVFGRATVDGTLYHGRVLDYMTEIGLQDAAVTFAVRPERGYGFVNVGYAGFVGSVTGINERGISLGELGGGGRGAWDGVPMASLMRTALEECATLGDVRRLWTESARTCEYFYVAADGKARTAVGIAATPEQVEFLEPGADDPRLPGGIDDVVYLSGGDRLERLAERIRARHGAIDREAALHLMDRPVAMRSNLHNVLMAPESGELWIAHAGDETPAAERPYVRHAVPELLADLGDGQRVLPARDTLAPEREAAGDGAGEMLEQLCWQPSAFDVTVEPRARGETGTWSALVTFPSPTPSGDATNDRVTLEWYAPRRPTASTPAVLVLHILDGRMLLARSLATAFARFGVHAFVMHLPTYGRRGTRSDRADPAGWLRAMRQGIADARRARDAIAALPGVDPAAVDIQGTSLGAFVAASAAALDRGFRHAFLMLAGGGLRDLFAHGGQDVAKLRARVERAGIDVETLGAALDAVDPARLAHRLDPAATWLFSARHDLVVPERNARLLAERARLDAAHHVWVEADHYSAIVHLPGVFRQMLDRVVAGEPAFRPVIPGARGFGVDGPIARGKPILRVTNTSAAGEGSLHAAVLEAHEHGGGIVVFETSGVIDVESSSPSSRLLVDASNLWIAGQTAPPPGIFLRGELLLAGGDFVVQHLGVYRPAQARREADAISLQGTHRGAPPGRAILDHVAAWGGNDGNLDISNYAGGEVTVQHSILAAPLRGGHPKGEAHNFNSLIYGAQGGKARATYRLNLFSTALDRQPLSSFDELVLVNNVYYNREPRIGRYVYLRNGYHNDSPSLNSIVGNVFWDTSREFARLPILLRAPGSTDGGFSTESRIFLADNWWNLTEPHVARDPWRQLVYASGNPREPILAQRPPVWNRRLDPLPSTEVLETVRATAGPRPAARIPLLETLTAELGGEPTHGFPSSLDEIGGELLGLEENHRELALPDEPHALESNGYTRIENLLFGMAREVE